VARHRQALAGDRTEELYLALARATVQLAAEAGTEPEALARITTLLEQK
jgi:hypothetical protein